MIEVLVLSGKRDAELLKRCIESFTLNYSYPLYFRVISDGTICNAGDIPPIHGNFEILEARQLERAANQVLRRFPRIRKALEQSVLFRKLVYCRVASSGKRVNYVDSDVFAIRKCAGLFESDAKHYFMDNVSSIISLRWKEAGLLGAMPVADSVNSGLISCNRDLVDFELMEWALGFPDIFKGSKFHLEQTMWSILAGSQIQDVFLWDSEQVCFPDRKTRRSKSTAILHFTQPNRGGIRSLEKSYAGYVSIGARRAQRLTPMKFLRQRAGAKSWRMLRKPC